MSRFKEILKCVFILLMTLVLATGCASSKNAYVKKKKKVSIVNTSQLGRNRYFFSNDYQKKLTKNYNKR